MITTSILAFALASSWIVAKEKKVIEKRDDLPRYTYKINMKAVDLYQNESALLELASKVKKDLENDLDSFIINDKTTLQDFYTTLGTIATLEGRWSDYLGYIEKRRELEDKEATRLTMGMVGEAIAEGKKAGTSDLAAFVGEFLQKKVSEMPYSVVEANLKSAKGSSEIISPALVQGQIGSAIQPMLDQSGGEMSREVASQLLGAGFTLKYYVLVKDQVGRVLSTVINANKVEKDDIWAARQVNLEAEDGNQPVVLAVWDSGVDTDIFEQTQQIWVNKNEIPGNNRDDDKNGYVDDVHGIAYSLHSDKEKSILFPIGELSSDPKTLQRQMKGITDIQSAIDSPEASELKQKLSTLKPEEAKPLIEEINLFANYSHGTHVAGITAEGNPHVRILAARITFDHRMIPEEPTVEQAKKDAKALTEVIQYFKDNGVRAVNMSWGGSIAGIERALEMNNAGGTPEERKALAREIFSIGDKALREAIQGAPEIFFITSAGNDDNDVRFDEFLPSSYDFPNIISVGAVDQAGDETSFTSFGKVDVYANGFEVSSYVPGGDQLKLNGTSMSSPQVLNLVGKLLAVNPYLSVEQLRSLVLDGSDEKKVGDRTVKLLNPKNSLRILTEQSG
jgi:subtilisin family serine protease